jgi:2-keto-3-deoxy-L-rhamnonate aldolase RhmA
MKIAQNSFLQGLLQAQSQFGVWASFPSNATVEALSHSTYDWMLIDAEHAPISIDTLHSQLQAASSGALEVVVRPPQCEQALVKRMLDLGVQNFMFPMIDTPEQAQAAVSYTRYPPHGVRGIAGAMRASKYGRIDKYLHTAHTQIAVIVQLESKTAVDNTNAIASVTGVNACFIGPNDLAASMGFPGELKHPEVQAAIDQAIRAVQQAGKCVGILCSSYEDAAHFHAKGVRLIACGSDTRLLTRAADALGSQLKAIPTLAVAPSMPKTTPEPAHAGGY